MRQRDGYLKPDSMKEDAFAIVLVGDKCQVRRARVLDPLVESTSGADASTSCAQVAGCVSTKKVSTLWASARAASTPCASSSPTPSFLLAALTQLFLLLRSLVSRAGAKKIEGLHKKTLSCTPYALFAGTSPAARLAVPLLADAVRSLCRQIECVFLSPVVRCPLSRT